MKRLYASTLVVLSLLFAFRLAPGAAFAAEQSGNVPDEYVQKLLAYVKTKTVDGKTLVYYRPDVNTITLVVCTINKSEPNVCDVVMYTGFPNQSMYEFFKNTVPDEEKKSKMMTFVDELQCYYTKGKNESLAMRQKLSTGEKAVIVR